MTKSPNSSANYANYDSRSALNRSNSMTALLDKVERKLQVKLLTPHLPDICNKDTWANVIQNDTLVTFSRYFPNMIKMVINDETCYKKYDNQHLLWYYIKDEILQGVKLLGMEDIDWMDTSSNNAGLGASSVGNYFYPSFSCPVATYESILGLQTAADFNSLYNRGIWIDFQYPNRFCLRGIGNVNYDLNTFTVKLLCEHTSLSTISPTKMEIFEKLATADIANHLLILKYIDNMDTAFVTINLQLQYIEEWANKRDAIVEELDNAHVTTSNDNIPYIFTV